jgi:hypothetical protein
MAQTDIERVSRRDEFSRVGERLDGSHIAHSLSKLTYIQVSNKWGSR